MNDLLNSYAYYLAEAVNTNCFPLIGSYLTYGSEIYNQQQKNIPISYADGDQERFIRAIITAYNISDDNQSGSITTSETYNFLTKNGNSSNKTYNHVYKFQYNSDTSSYQFTNRK